jgi:hypothetical protein
MMNHNPTVFTFQLSRRSVRRSTSALACAALLAMAGAGFAAEPAAPRDNELRNSIVTLRDGTDEAARNAAVAHLEQLAKRFSADPYIGVQLANAYGVQARFAKTRDAKAVWAAKAEGALNEVVAANPNYLLAQATRGLQMVMSPPALGLEAQGEQELKRVIASKASSNNDDDEAIITAHLFLARLYDRQAKALSGDAQALKTRAAEQVRADVRQRYPRLDVARLAS